MKTLCICVCIMGIASLNKIFTVPSFGQSNPSMYQRYPSSKGQYSEKGQLQAEMIRLAESGAQEDFEKLGEYAANQEAMTRRMAATALGKSKNKDTYELLIFLLDDENRQVRSAAALSLGKLKDAKAFDQLMEVAEKDDSSDVKGSAIFAIGQLGTEKALDIVIASLNSDLTAVRSNAAATLATAEDKKVIDPLIETLKDKEDQVRMRAAQSLKMLTGQDQMVENLSKESVEKGYQIWRDWWAKNKDTFKIAKRGPSGMARKWIETYDKDKNASLNEEELTAAIEAMYKGGPTIQKGETLNRDVRLRQLDGSDKTLSELMKGDSLIYYFSSKCMFCIKAESSIKGLFSEFKDRGPKIIGIASARDTTESLKTYVEKAKFEFPVYLDFRGEFSSKNHVPGTPNVVIAGSDGKVKEYFRGLSEKNVSQVRNAIAQ